MKYLMLVLSLLGVGMSTTYSQTPQKVSVRPKSGFVPNEETAVKIAEVVLVPVYGAKTIRDEEPFKARREGDVWRVEGSLNCGAPHCFGGTAVVRISKSSGEILFMAHYK
jgi:hypothetical protein